MDIEGDNQPTEELNESAAQSLDQGGDSGEQSNAGVDTRPEESQTTLAEGEFLVGKQRFTQDGLIKSYGELQKKYTQDRQEATRERELHNGLRESLKGILGDPTKRDLLVKLMRGELSPQQVVQKSDQRDQRQLAQRPNVQDDSRVNDLEARLDRAEAQKEYEAFVSKHVELSAKEVQSVLAKLISLSEAGKDRSMEEVYRTEFFETAAAKFFSKGEAEATAKIKKNSEGAALTGAPPMAKQPPTGKRYGQLKGSKEQNAWMDRKMSELKMKFDDDEE